MHITTLLRKVGDSVMLTVPPALLAELKLQAGSPVHLRVEQNALIVRTARPRYTLEELLQQCDAAAPATDEDLAWLHNHPVGSELP